MPIILIALVLAVLLAVDDLRYKKDAARLLHNVSANLGHSGW